VTLRALAERWNGARWSITAIPVPFTNGDSRLSSVSCLSSSDCVAVGSYADGIDTTAMMIEHWNGSTWSIQFVPTPAGVISSSLHGVACPSDRSCVAVGAYTVSNDFTGMTDRPLTEQWDGTRWSVRQPPLPAGSEHASLSGVSCTSPTACTAVGSTGSLVTQILAERWDGHTWSTQVNAIPRAVYSSLNAVSCSAANFCTAVGSFTRVPYGSARTLAEVWYGAAWSLQSTPNPGGSTVGPNGTPGVGTVLSGVACTAASACIAVGSTTNGNDTLPPFAERLG
jgi:hypothetical protein